MTDLEQLSIARKSFDSWRTSLLQQQGARDKLIQVRDQEEKNSTQLRETARLNTQAHLFLLSEITERRQQAVGAIESMGTSALQLIYGEGYSLKFHTEEDKKTASGFRMEILLGSPYEGEELFTGLWGHRGGGALEIIGFALRIAALNLVGYNGPIVLDETFGAISDDGKIDSVSRFLRQICDQMGRQIIFATHKLNVFGPLADHIIHVTKETNGIAKIETVSPSDIVGDNLRGSSFEIEEENFLVNG